MSANTEKSRKAKDEARLRLAKRLVYAAAVIFAVVGLVMLYGAKDEIPPLGQPDPVFGRSTGKLLMVAGFLHLAIGGCLLATRDPMKLGLVACWAGFNYIVYLAGVAWLKAAGGIPALVVLGWELGVSANLIHVAWRWFIVYLVVDGLLLVTLEHRRLQRLEAEAYLKHWHEVREHGHTAPTSPGKL